MVQSSKTTQTPKSRAACAKRHIHPSDLMSPDFLSEIILIGGTVILVGLLFALVRILLQCARAFS
jgi:hypothetical protein